MTVAAVSINQFTVKLILENLFDFCLSISCQLSQQKFDNAKDRSYKQLGCGLLNRDSSPCLRYTVVIFLEATKGKSQNRISLKRQRFLKTDKIESFLDFYIVYKYVYLKVM